MTSLSSVCGERGIRTPEPLLTVTRFPGVPLQPLEHLSLAVVFALAAAKLRLIFDSTSFYGGFLWVYGEIGV